MKLLNHYLSYILITSFFFNTSTSFASNTFQSSDSQAATDDCPLSIFSIVMSSSAHALRSSLSYGADPNTSIENCPWSLHRLRLQKMNSLPFSSVWDYEYVHFPEGTTLLHIAAYHHAKWKQIPSYIRSLLRHSWWLWFRNADGLTTYDLLLETGADDSIPDANGHTPHQLANGVPCLNEELEIIICSEDENIQSEDIQ